MITFFVKGTPVPCARPRVTRFATFTPKKTQVWKNQIAWESKLHRPQEPFTGPLFMMLIFLFERPKAHKDKTYCIGRSDIDNYCKSVMDALHGQFYNNDNQVVSLSAVKVYVKPPEKPGVRITVGEMKNLKNHLTNQISA